MKRWVDIVLLHFDIASNEMYLVYVVHFSRWANQNGEMLAAAATANTVSERCVLKKMKSLLVVANWVWLPS